MQHAGVTPNFFATGLDVWVEAKDAGRALRKRSGKPITPKERPVGGNVVDLMEALRRSAGGAEPAKPSKASKKPRKAASGQKEMLMTIAGKKPAKEAAAANKTSRQQRKSA